LTNNEITNGHLVTYVTETPVIGTYQPFNANTNVSANCLIAINDNPLDHATKVKYFTNSGNTVIAGLTNNQIYYVYASNSSSVVLSRSPDQVYTDVTNTNVFVNGSITTTTSGETNPTGVFFKPDGTRMFVCGQTIDRVNEYQLSTPWMVNTATFTTATTMSMETLYGEFGMDDIYFTSNGTTMYVLGYTTDKVLQFELGEQWTVNTAAYVANTSIAGQTDAARAMTFKPDGSRMYVVDTTNDKIFQYELETPWDLSSSIYHTDDFYSGGLGDGNAAGIAFTQDGRKVFLVGYDNDRISSITLTTPWDIKSGVEDPEHKYLAAGSNSFGLFMKSDNRFYIADTNSDTIKEYDWTYMIPSSISETGHNLFRQTYWVINANTSGFQISYEGAGQPIDLVPSNTSQTQTIALKNLQDNMTYYALHSDHPFLALAFSPTSANVINITPSANSEVGHYLSKIIEETI
jgi:sugar lactone lactonase YvrE